MTQYENAFKLQQLEIKTAETDGKFDFYTISVLRRTLDLMRKDLARITQISEPKYWKDKLTYIAKQQLYNTQKFDDKLKEYGEFVDHMKKDHIFSCSVLVDKNTSESYVVDIWYLTEYPDALFRFFQVVDKVTVELIDWAQRQEQTKDFYTMASNKGLLVMLDYRPDLVVQVLTFRFKPDKPKSALQIKYELVMDFLLYLPFINVLTIGSEIVDNVERGEDIYGNKLEIFGYKITSYPERIAYAMAMTSLNFLISKFAVKLVKRFSLGLASLSSKMVGATLEYLKLRSLALGRELRPMVLALYLRINLMSKPYWKSVLEPAAEHVFLNNSLTPEISQSITRIIPTMVLDISKDVSSIIGKNASFSSTFTELVGAQKTTDLVRVASKNRGAITYKDLQSIPEIILQPNLLTNELAADLSRLGQEFSFMKNFSHYEVEEMLDKALSSMIKGKPLNDEQFVSAIQAELVERVGLSRYIPALLSREGHVALRGGGLQYAEFAKKLGYETTGKLLGSALENVLENGKELLFIAGKFRILINGKQLFTDGLHVTIEESGDLMVWAIHEAKSTEGEVVKLFASGTIRNEFVDNLSNIFLVTKNMDIYKKSQLARDAIRMMGEKPLKATIKDLGGGIKCNLVMSPNCVFFATIPKGIKGMTPEMVLQAESAMEKMGIRVQTWTLDATTDELKKIALIIASHKSKYVK